MGFMCTGVGARSDRLEFFFQLAGKSFLGSQFIGGSGTLAFWLLSARIFCLMWILRVAVEVGDRNQRAHSVAVRGRVIEHASGKDTEINCRHHAD